LGGCLLVLIPVMGEYLIPVLLGGGRSYFLGNALADLFLQSRNWPLGAALAAAFIALMTVILLFYGWFSRRVSGAPRTEVPS
jgi:spermidine/putrescine transport system permease protein